MTKTQKQSPRFLPLLLLLFAGSGCSALIYEIVWYQLLQLVIGSTRDLARRAAGHLHGRPVPGQPRAAAVDVAREASIRCACTPRWNSASRSAASWCSFGMPLVDGVYTAAVGHGLPAILLRALVCAICLLPPTLLMGASLPAAARWIETTPEGVSWMGLLYGGNTGGAVFGCLLAGFYLLRVFDMATATFVAAAINVAVALVSLCARAARARPRRGSDARRGSQRARLLAGLPRRSRSPAPPRSARR